MARITVEDCLVHIPSHFDLTLIAAKRARQLARGAATGLPWNDHKSTVLALQEIAGGQVGASVLAEPDLPPLARQNTGIESLDPAFLIRDRSE